MIKIGCCGFPVRKEEYFENLDLVEINQTFYQLPSPQLAKKWRLESPPNFEYTIKASQLITHPPTSLTYRKLKEKIPEDKKLNYGFFRPTKEVFNALERTLEIAEILNSKIVLFQTPASFSYSDENFRNMNEFFKYAKKYKFIYVWEVRGKWQNEFIVRICKKFDLNHSVDPLYFESLYGEYNYFRLHGRWDGKRISYMYNYTPKDLNKVFLCCKRKINYVLFNNISMFQDAIKFKKQIIKLC